MEQIIIEIGKDGAVKIKTQGFKGASCMDATRAIKEALGTVMETEKTAEFYEVAVERKAWVINET